MEGILVCGICHEGLKDPKTLPCLHSFCLACLVAHRTFNESWKCPLCRTPIELGSKRIEDLPNDHFIQNLIDAQSTEPQNPNDIKCEICEMEPASSRCVNCTQFFCERCQVLHKKAKVSANHQFITLEDYFKQDGKQAAKNRISHCHEHPHLPIDSFCKTCNISTCPSCAVKKHSEHSFAPIEDVIPDFINKINSHFPKAEEKEKSLKEAIKKLGSEIDQVRFKSEKAKEELNKQIDSMIAEIELRRVELLDEIEKKKEAKEKVLRNQKDELEMVQVGLETCLNFGRKLIQEGNGIEISLSVDYFLKRISNLKDQQVQLQPISDSRIEFGSTGIEQLQASIKKFGTVLDFEISTEKTFAEINGTEVHQTPTTPVIFQPKSPFSFQIVSVAQNGTKLERGGAQFDYSLDPHIQDLQVSISDLRTGRYQVELKFEKEEGMKTNLSIKLRDQLIKGFPIPFECQPHTFPPFGQAWFGNNKRFEILYDAKRDGFSSQTFHQKCDNKGPTITLVKLKNGSVFGGYSSVPWDTSNNYKQAPGSFIFSLTDGKGRGPSKFDLKPENVLYSIYCYSNYGPTFGGGHDCVIHLSSLASSYSNFGHTYQSPRAYGSNEAMHFLAGSYNNWEFDNVQVFSVI